MIAVRRRLRGRGSTFLIVLSLLAGLCLPASAATVPGRVAHLPAALAALHRAALRGYPAPQHLAVPAAPAKSAVRSAVVRPQTASVGTAQAIGGDQKLTVSWTAATGGPAGLYYSVTATDQQTNAAAACTTTTTSCTIGALTNGHQYVAQVSVCGSSTPCAVAATTAATYAARWPDAVSAVSVSSGDRSVSASWAPPPNNGGLAVSSYFAMLFQAGATGYCYAAPVSSVTVTNPRVTFSVATPQNGTAPADGTGYFVEVIAFNATEDGYTDGPSSDCYPNAGGSAGTSSPVAIAGAQSAQHEPAFGQFTPTDAAPLVSTYLPLAVNPGGAPTVQVLGQAGVPATGVSGVMLALSGTSPNSATGDLWLYDSDLAQPTGPALVASGTGKAVTLTVPISASGTVTLKSDALVNVHLDVLGYYSDQNTYDVGSTYAPVTPALLASSSSNLQIGTLTSSSSTDPKISTRTANGLLDGIARNATAVTVSVQLGTASQAGSLFLYSPASSHLPDVPTAYTYTGTGAQSAAVATVPLDSNGQFQIHLSAGTVAADIRVLGYYTGPRDAHDGVYDTVSAVRVLDTGTGSGPAGSKTIGAGQSLVVSAPTGAPSPAQVETEWLLVRPYNVTTAGRFAVYKTGALGTGVSVLALPGQDAAMLVPVPVDSAGTVTIGSDTAVGSVTVDVLGYSVSGLTPGAPLGIKASPLAGGAYVNWAAPCNDGGAPIAHYTVTASPGGASATVDGSATEAFLYGLTDGTAYTFTVTAANSTGAGPVSAASAPVTPAATAPQSPDQPGAQAGDTQALVSWVAPARNGDSPITGYTVTASPGGATQSVGASIRQVVVSGLTNGTTYTFTVQATNAIGSSQASKASISVTPAAGGSLAPLAIRGAAFISSATPATAQPCAPVAASVASTAPDTAASVTRYQIAGHLVTMIKPPSSLDLGTASLATLHQYGYALTVKDAKGLAAWQHRVGHVHPVPATPCLTKNRSQAQSHANVCALNGSTSSSTSDGYGWSHNWSGLEDWAPSSPAPDPRYAVIDTGNPFIAAEGEWYQGTFTPQPGGENLESSWVGIGGDGQDSHTFDFQLIQAGTAQQDGNAPYPWYELLGPLNDEPMISVSGMSVHPGDLMDVQILINDTAKTLPWSANPALPDISTATITISDFTTNQTAPTIVVNAIDGQYDGRVAEFIDEDVTKSSACGFLWLSSCDSLYALPKWTAIHWMYALATVQFSRGGLNTTGPPSFYDYRLISMKGNDGHDMVVPGAVYNIPVPPNPAPTNEGWFNQWQTSVR